VLETLRRPIRIGKCVVRCATCFARRRNSLPSRSKCLPDRSAVEGVRVGEIRCAKSRWVPFSLLVRGRGRITSRRRPFGAPGGAGGANVVLVPELFETPYFCAVEDSAYLKLARPLADTRPSSISRRGLGTRRGHPRVGLRARRRRALQLRGRDRCRRQDRRPLIERAIFHKPPGYEESTTSLPATADFGRYRPPTASSASHMLGPVVPEAARSLVCRAPSSSVSDGDRHRAKSPDLDSMEHWRIWMRAMRARHGSRRGGQPNSTETTDGVSMTSYGSPSSPITSER